MYLRNHWYVVAGSEELGERQLLPCTIMGEPMVLYRQQDGTPVALFDRCAHRQAPLSLGELTGEGLRCNYHGLVYDRSGQCVHVPGQAAVPPGAKVRAYPLAERHSWIWAWMGDAEQADPSTIPDFSLNTAPGWEAVGEHIVMRGNYQLLIDNLMDLSHLGYLHRKTIGTPESSEKSTIRTMRTERGVRVERVTRATPQAPLWREVKKADDDIVDRWSIIEFEPPASIFILTTSTPVGQGETDAARSRFSQALVANFITPRTEDSLHYFWRYTRNYGIGNADWSQKIFQGVRQTFVEDTQMIEGQQLNRGRDPDYAMVDIGFDAGPLAVRRLMAELMAAEPGVHAPAQAAE